MSSNSPQPHNPKLELSPGSNAHFSQIVSWHIFNKNSSYDTIFAVVLIITQIPKILWNKAHLQHFVASCNSAFNKNFPCHRTSPVKPLESLFAAIRSWPKVWPRPLSSVHQGAWHRLYQTLAPTASSKCTFKAWLANISSSTFKVNNQGLTSE